MASNKVVVDRKLLRQVLDAIEEGLMHISYSSDTIRQAARALDASEPRYVMKSADKAYNSLQKVSDKVFEIVHRVNK
jgi:hypothetical protein